MSGDELVHVLSSRLSPTDSDSSDTMGLDQLRRRKTVQSRVTSRGAAGYTVGATFAVDPTYMRFSDASDNSSQDSPISTETIEGRAISVLRKTSDHEAVPTEESHAKAVMLALVACVLYRCWHEELPTKCSETVAAHKLKRV